MYRLIDSHAHLEELEELDEAIERARNSGVVAIVAVGSDYESNNRVLEIAQKYMSYVCPALGFHPGRLQAARANIDRNLRFIEDNIEGIVAIGEIGLDYHKRVLRECSRDMQKEVLKEVLGLARKYDKPAIIHSRYAWRDAFNMVAEAQVSKAVFHWYTGPLNVLEDILARGHYISAALAAEYHQEHRRAIKKVPLERILLETDSPVVYREGTQFEHEAEPADVVRTLQAVAQLKGMSEAEVAERTTENATRLYGLRAI